MRTSVQNKNRIKMRVLNFTQVEMETWPEVEMKINKSKIMQQHSEEGEVGKHFLRLMNT